MKKWLAYCLLGSWLGLITACSSSGPRDQPPPVMVSEAEYKLGVGDQIGVQVWKSPDLSVEVPVRPDGRVSVPLVGDVPAAGRSTRELAEALTIGLEEYVRNPQVTVIVLNPSSGEFLRRVRVTGAVVNPMSLPHQQGMTVLDLVLQAGGLTEFASGNRARLYRRYDEKIEVFPILLDDILSKGELNTNYLLGPSDIVTVPERRF